MCLHSNLWMRYKESMKKTLLFGLFSLSIKQNCRSMDDNEKIRATKARSDNDIGFLLIFCISYHKWIEFLEKESFWSKRMNEWNFVSLQFYKTCSTFIYFSRLKKKFEKILILSTWKIKRFRFREPLALISNKNKKKYRCITRLI